MSSKEKSALRLLKRNRNKAIVINNTDKNVGPATAETTQDIEENRQQLYDKEVHKNQTEEEAKQFVRETQISLSNIVKNRKKKGTYTSKEVIFLRSKLYNFHVSHFISSGKFKISNCRQTHSGWVQLDINSSIIFFFLLYISNT